MILQDRIETGDQCREAARSIAIQNPYRNDGRRFRDAVIGSGDDACHMRSMTITVGGPVVVGEGVEARTNPATEIVVRREDAGIDDIDSHANARSAARVTPVEWESALIDSIQSPRRLRGVNSGILFDELHTRVARERLCVGITDLDR